MESTQSFKTVYFQDYKSSKRSSKGLTLAFGKKDKRLHNAVKDLDSSDLRKKIGFESYQELTNSAKKEGLSINTFCLWLLKKTFGLESYDNIIKDELNKEAISLKDEVNRSVEIGKARLIAGDALAGMMNLPDQSFDLAISDPPYGASTKATWLLGQEHNLKGFGGAWKLASHEWDFISGLDGFRFTYDWLNQLKRIVRPTGSIWIHSTYHNSGMVNVACQMLGLEIINEVVWFKRNAFPNLSGRRLAASHETILWVHTGGKKRHYNFNYEDTKKASFEVDNIKQPGKQMRTVWDIPNNKTKEELEYGKHPTQKPLRVTDRMLLVSGKKDGNVLIPFMGSGTEMVAALRWGMNPTGYEIDPVSFDLASRRLNAETEKNRSKLINENLYATKQRA